MFHFQATTVGLLYEGPSFLESGFEPVQSSLIWEVNWRYELGSEATRAYRAYSIMSKLNYLFSSLGEIFKGFLFSPLATIFIFTSPTRVENPIISDPHYPKPEQKQATYRHLLVSATSTPLGGRSPCHHCRISVRWSSRNLSSC